jgi:Bacterial Ig-like domain
VQTSSRRRAAKKILAPPQIVKARSTPNLQTLFKKQDIHLVFDEWLKLEDVYNQVVVSPPLNERPEVTLDGKTIHVKFAKDEILREDATYTINFGNAVKDFTEGNPAADLQFVISIDAIFIYF